MVDSHGSLNERDSAELLSINTALNSSIGANGFASGGSPANNGAAVSAGTPTATLPSNRSVPGMSPSSRSVPAMSPSLNGGRSGRGLRQKMMDELKHVRRKSPPPEKNTPSLTPVLQSSAGLMPPPLMLNVPSNDDYRSSQGEDGGRVSGSGDQLSPVDPGLQGKTKGCSICERSFTVFRAKHTCKVCGRRICDDCSKNRVKLNRRLERKKGSRLCDPCARKYVQSSMPLMSPVASPMLVPQKALQRRHSVPNQAFARTLSGNSTSANTAANAKLAESQSSQSSDSVASSAATTPKGGSATHTKAVEKQEPHNSHLRLRHWISLSVITVLVLLRILIGTPSSTNADGSLDEEKLSFLMFPSYFIAKGLDSVLSIKILGCYTLGLVVFDEILRTKNSTSLVRSAKPARRKRTTSTLSEKSKAVALAACPEQEDDEVLEVDTGDKLEETGFSLEKLTATLEDTTVKVRAANDELKTSSFLSCCEAICGFVLVFGRATSFAGSTVGAYITSIDANLAAWPPAAGTSLPWKHHSLRAVIEREVELQIASIGGKKKPSCSRCVLRLLWFVEFVEACIRYTLIESTDENCSAGASKAYEETIGSRHPWIIRKGVNSALGSIPTRSAILADLNLSSCTPEDAIARMKVAQTHMKAIVAEIHQVLKQHDLLDIK